MKKIITISKDDWFNASELESEIVEWLIKIGYLSKGENGFIQVNNDTTLIIEALDGLV